jgi:hypothetical protein
MSKIKNKIRKKRRAYLTPAFIQALPQLPKKADRIQ